MPNGGSGKKWTKDQKYGVRMRYGLSPEQFEELWRQCDGLCVICETRPPKVVDHDHATLKVRGLLCAQCNTGIGMLADDTMRLAKAMCYLINHDERAKPSRPKSHPGRRARGGKSLPKNDPRRPNRKVR